MEGTLGYTSVVLQKQGGVQLRSVMIRTSSDLMLEEIVLMKHDEIEWRVSRYDSATCVMKN